MVKQQSSLVSLEHWHVASDFTGDEVTALVMGDDPSSANYSGSEGRPLYRKLKESYNAAKRWHALDDHAQLQWDQIGVGSKEELLNSIGVAQALLHFDLDEAENFASWLASDERSGFSIQRFTRAEVRRWLDACGVQSIYEFTENKSAKSESLSQKERNTMLKLIVGMAVAGYKYSPVSKNNGDAIKEIQNDLADLDMSLSDDTIRNYLKEAVEKVLPGKKLD